MVIMWSLFIHEPRKKTNIIKKAKNISIKANNTGVLSVKSILIFPFGIYILEHCVKQRRKFIKNSTLSVVRFYKHKFPDNSFKKYN